MIDFDNTATDEDIYLIESIAEEYVGTIDSPPQNIPVGSVNKVFRVDIQRKAYIFRISQEQNKIQEYEKEGWCIDQALQAGVKSPKVLKIGRLENTTFMIQPFVEGKLCTDPTLNKKQIWESLGLNLAKIHSISTKGVGLNLIDPKNNQFSDSWEKWIDHNIDSIHDQDVLLTLGYVNTEEHGAMKQCFETIRSNEWQFGLCHGDLSLRNAILSNDGNTTIIDWGCARSDVVPFFDFAQIIRWEKPTAEQFEAFLRAYGIDSQASTQLEKNILRIVLYYATDTLRWAIDHNHQTRGRYIAGLRWALDLYLGKIEWFSEPYHEEYGL